MDRVLGQLARLHHSQLGWRMWVRVAWWFFLLPVAAACWTADQRTVPLKVVGWATVAVVTVFWSAGVAAALNPTPSTTAHTVAADSAPPQPSASTPTPVPSFTIIPDPVVQVTPPPTTIAPATPSSTPPIVIAPLPPTLAAAVAPSVHPAPVRTPPPVATHTTTAPPAAPSCTLTGTGKCIQGGEFCPVAKEGKAGYDANGTRYVCTDSDHDGHPHWE